MGLPWWSSGDESTCQRRRHGLDLHLGTKILHAAGQLSPCATPREACTPRVRAPQKEKALQWEARTPQLERRPHTLQLEKNCVQQQRPSTAENYIIKKKKVHDTCNTLETIPHPGWWKNCLPRNGSLVPKRLETPALEQGSLWTGTHLGPVRNRASQQEVSGRWVSEASSVFTAAPHGLHLSGPWKTIFHKTTPWSQKGWGPLL